jgi:hypothetical protein
MWEEGEKMNFFSLLPHPPKQLRFRILNGRVRDFDKPRTHPKTLFYMKRIPFFSFLLLLPFWAMAQPKVKRLTNERLEPGSGWILISYNDYAYNKHGEETSNIRYNFDGGWYKAGAHLREYDEQGNLLKATQYYKRQTANEAYLYSETVYEIGQDGCTATELQRIFMENGEMDVANKSIYYSGPDCRRDSVLGMRCDSVGNSLVCSEWYYFSYEFDANGNKTVENQGFWDIFSQNYYRLDSAVVYQYNPTRQLTSVTYSDADRPYSVVQYTYHPDGQIATTSIYNASDTGWELFRSDSVGYEYMYDDQGFLVRKNTNYYDLISTLSYGQESIYLNYCDGLPHVELWNSNIRTTFEYTEGVDCQNPNLLFAPTVSPNPADDYIRIDYTGLERGKTYASLHNAHGAEVVGYKVWYRTDTIELDVSQVAKGIYFLRIADGKKLFGRKIVIMR